MSVFGIIKSILSVFSGITIDKIRDHGFWASQQFYWQSLFIYFYYCFRFKSFTFFSATNPAISLGGMLDDTKTEVYALLNQKIVPTTAVFRKGVDINEIISGNRLTFPVICKPDIGYKGHNVVKIENMELLIQFFDKQDTEIDWLIQEYVNYEKEYSLLYYHLPQSNKTGISSFIEKVYPFVIGDGQSSLEQLIMRFENAYLKKSWILKKWKDHLGTIPENGAKIILDYIGNYSRGAKFFSRMNLVDTTLLQMSDEEFMNTKGMYFFRADLKADDIIGLRSGKFKILEINGAKSEPLHLYDPKFGFFGRWKIIRDHWKILTAIVREVKEKEDFSFPSRKEGLAALASIKEKVK